MEEFLGIILGLHLIFIIHIVVTRVNGKYHVHIDITEVDRD